MAETIILDVQQRERTGRKMRSDEKKRIPAVLYGHDVDNQNLWVETTPFIRAFSQAGESTVLTLMLGKEKRNVLIHDYQVDPVSNAIIHVDFFQVRMDEEVTTDVPITYVGESAAVKTLGGTLTTTDTITVRALPGDLPQDLTIDIGSLATFDDVLSVADLKISDKVEVLVAQDTTIASVTPPRTQEEVDAADEEIDADVSRVEGVADADDAQDAGDDAAHDTEA